MAVTGDFETGFMTPGEQSSGHRRVCIEAGKIRGRQLSFQIPREMPSNHWRSDTHGDKSAKPRPPATLSLALHRCRTGAPAHGIRPDISLGPRMDSSTLLDSSR